MTSTKLLKQAETSAELLLGAQKWMHLAILISEIIWTIIQHI